MDALGLLRELVSAYGPPGQEEAVRALLLERLNALGLASETDAKGNLIVRLGERPRMLVTAHMDEIALLTTGVCADGSLLVSPMGGLSPWKIGEGMVSILGSETVPGVLGFGAMHTEDPSARSVRAKEDGVSWAHARVDTGLPAARLVELGIGPGTRIVAGDRDVHEVGRWVAGRFLDDRADLVSWLLALEELKNDGPCDVWFAATVAEEVGGEGAQYLMQKVQPDICVALELGPDVPDAPVEIDDTPTLWVADSYAAMAPRDIEWVESLGPVQRQALSRGGSDASCAAGRGLCARPITLGLPMKNTHGFEIIAPGSMSKLAERVVALVRSLG